jgi:hypothetical protein
MKAIRLKCGDLVPYGYKGNYCVKCTRERIARRQRTGKDIA